MKRILYLTAGALVGLMASNASAGESVQPACDGWSCGDPCSKLRIGPIFGEQHTQKLIDQLSSESQRHRIDAVRKLGCELHADFCKNPEVLNALIHTLSCDKAPEVRWQAVWAIAGQGASVPEAIFALYVATKLDKNYLVRDDAVFVLKILTSHCRHSCHDLYQAADAFIAHLCAEYDPAKGKCVDLVAAFHDCHWAGADVLSEPASVPGGPKPESIPAPKEPGKDQNDAKESAAPPVRPTLTTLSGAPPSRW